MKPPYALGLIPCLLFTSCASLISRSHYPVSITSEPSGVKFTVKNQSGSTVHQGTTPSIVTLPAGAGYFKPASYTLEFTKKGSATQSIELNSRMNGWYFGNILFGGFIGMVVVDPLTGAMWRLDETVNAKFTSLATLDSGNGTQLQVVDRASLPAAMEKHLVAIR